MRAIIPSGLLFVGVGFLGPLVHWASWPPNNTSPSANFIYDVTLLSWPMQPLAVMEVSMGGHFALAIAVATNVLLFAVLGALAGILSKKKGLLFALYIVVCAITVLFALWAFGTPLSYSNVSALVSVALLYALLFFAVFKLRQGSRSQTTDETLAS